MLDQKADETLMCAERRAVDAERGLEGVVAILVGEIEARRDGEVDLVGGDGKFAADGAPNLNVDLRAVESGFVRHLDIVDAAALKDTANHVLSLEPEFGLVDVFLAKLGRIVGGETHHVFVDAEDLEILEIHFIDRPELGFELLLGAVDVGVVHLHGTDAHEAEEFAALLVAIAGAVFGETQG